MTAWIRQWKESTLPLKRLHTHIHRYQRLLIEYLKAHKALRLLHLFRQYSALTVVVSGAFLVTGTNIASESGALSLGGNFVGEDTLEFSQRHHLAAQTSKKNNLSLVPLANASTSVDPNDKDAALSEESLLEGSVLAAGHQSPIMKDPEENGGVSLYTVQDGDTLGSIALSQGITVNTILWANDVENADEIMPGDQIFILPVAGLKYIVAQNDTLETIAQKYKADKDRIIAYNDLPADGRIETGVEIIIPGGQKDEPLPSPAESDSRRRQYATAGGGITADISAGWRKLEGRAGAGHRFPYGYCTWYVSQKRYVPWGGNAGTWLYNAKALGYRTGKNPVPGAIVVTTENRYYGHVALVEKVSNGVITVSEMNYAGWGKVGRRTLSMSSRVIKGYIY